MSKKKVSQIALLLLSLFLIAYPVLADVNVSVDVGTTTTSTTTTIVTTTTTVTPPPAAVAITKTLISIPVALAVLGKAAMMMYGTPPEEKIKQFLVTLAIVAVGIFVLAAIGGL
jgi:uncharacterized membrane protein